MAKQSKVGSVCRRTRVRGAIARNWGNRLARFAGSIARCESVTTKLACGEYSQD
jgi:hypothetical protein